MAHIKFHYAEFFGNSQFSFFFFNDNLSTYMLTTID